MWGIGRADAAAFSDQCLLYSRFIDRHQEIGVHLVAVRTALARVLLNLWCAILIAVRGKACVGLNTVVAPPQNGIVGTDICKKWTQAIARYRTCGILAHQLDRLKHNATVYPRRRTFPCIGGRWRTG